jgi:hypothetical protein
MTPNVRARFEPVAWWFTREKIGRGLRERYQVPEELPPSVLTLVRKLDALEGNHLLRESKKRLRAAPRNDALVAGTFMNNACKSGHHTWCVPMSSVRHHVQIGSK